MKKLNIISLILSILFLSSLSLSAQKVFVSSVAPKDATYITVEEQNLTKNFLSGASSQTVEVESNLALFTKSSATWCKPSVNGKVVTISVEKNSGENERTATVTIYGKDNKSASVNVIQLGSKPSILVNEEKVEVDQFASKFTLGITSSVVFTFELPSWVNAPTPAPAIGFNNYEFTLDPITEPGTENSGFITIKATGLSSDIKIPITQKHTGTLRFAVISDIHFGNNKGEGPSVKVPKALKNIFKQKPLVDALFVVGDLTDGGTADQYTQLLGVFNDKTIVPEGMSVYFMMGNHDNYPGETTAEANYAVLGQPIHQYVEIKGYPFITISMNGKGTDGYGTVAQNFLKEKMADAATKYPGKPIFVFTHVPPKYTVYGSQTGDGGWGTEKLLSILNGYPQAVVFSGHSHFPLGDPRSIHQDKFTTVNDGSTTYSEVEPGLLNAGIHPEYSPYITEGVIVNVDNKMNIEMERWDTYRNVEILPRWNVKAPHNGSNFANEYKGRTGGEAPKFASGIKPLISEVDVSSCKVTFDQATDDEVVHHYTIELMDGNSVVTKFTKFSEFYLNNSMPLTLTINMSGIPSGKTLKARVTALDSYKNKSTPILSDEFTTGEYTPNPGATKPGAETMVLDLIFNEDGTATDNSSLKNTITTGSAAITTYMNDTYGIRTAKFPGSNTSFYKVNYKDNQALKDAFTNGFTYEVLYMSNNTGNVCPMSAQESGGAGIEQASGGQIQFWAHVGGSYQKIPSSTTVKAKQYYHVIAVYDKTATKLKMYVNGTPVGEVNATGSFAFPSNSAAHWIAIGGDAGTGATSQFPLDGEVVIARMYKKAVTRDEAYLMYQDYNKETPQEPGNTDITIPTTFPQSKIAGHWEFNASGISPVKTGNGVSLTATDKGGVTYIKEDGVNTAFIANSNVAGPTPNYLTLTHNLPATSGVDVKDYCIVMDVKALLSTDYLPLLWNHSSADDADIFVKKGGEMGLQGSGLNYSSSGFVQQGWNRIIINANLSNSKLDFYCIYPDGTRKEYKRTVTSISRFTLRTDVSPDIFRDNGNEDGDAYIAQLVLFNEPLTDAELNEISTKWSE